MAKKITVQLEVNSKGAAKSIDRVNGEMVSLGQASEMAGGNLRQSFSGLKSRAALAENGLEAVTIQAKQAAAASRQVAGSGARANQVLFDFGQAAQDAGYGIQFAVNNMPMLLQNVQRLKAETGGTKAAMSALAGSMTGFGAVILAINLIPLIAQFVDFGEAAEDTGDKIEGAGEKAKKAEQDLKSMVDQMVRFEELETAQFQKITKEALPRLLSQSAHRLGQLQQEVDVYDQRIKGIRILAQVNSDLTEEHENRIDEIKSERNLVQSRLDEEEALYNGLVEQAKLYQRQRNLSERLEASGVSRKETEEETIENLGEQVGLLGQMSTMIGQMMQQTPDQMWADALVALGKVNTELLDAQGMSKSIADDFKRLLNHYQEAEKVDLSPEGLAKTVQENVDEAVQAKESLVDQNKKTTKSEDALAQGARAAASAIASSAVAAAQASENRAEAIGNAARAAIRAFMAEAIAAKIAEAIKTTGPFAIAAAPAAAALVAGAFEALVPKFAHGGLVRGPGGPEEDKIPARLSDGEFVVNAKATREHQPLLEAINSGMSPMFSPSFSQDMQGAVMTLVQPQKPSVNIETGQQELVKEVRAMRQEMENLERVMPVDEYERKRAQFKQRRSGLGGRI